LEAFDKTHIWIDRQTAMHRMNTWGKGQRPFLFLTDYLIGTILLPEVFKKNTKDDWKNKMYIFLGRYQ